MKNFITEAIYEDSHFYLAGRIADPLTGTNLVQADLSAIVLKIYAQSDATTAIATPTITVSDVIFNTLQTGGWTVDSTGYNFRYLVLPAHLTTGGETYRFEFKFTRASTGIVFHQVFEVPTIGLYSS